METQVEYCVVLAYGGGILVHKIGDGMLFEICYEYYTPPYSDKEIRRKIVVNLYNLVSLREEERDGDRCIIRMTDGEEIVIAGTLEYNYERFRELTMR